VAKEVMAIKYSNQTGLSIKKFLESPFAGKHPKLIKKGTKAATAEAAVTAAEAIAVADLEEAKRLAVEFEALGGGALTMALAQEAEPGGPLARVLARTRAAPRVGGPLDQPRGNLDGPRGRTDAAAEVAEVTAAEAAAAEAAAAVEAAVSAEAAAAAGAAAKAAADALGARTALAPELPKEPGGGADGMAEDAEEIPGRPMFSVRAERSTPIKFLRSLQYTNALFLMQLLQ
jgi:hypothetical protein